MAFKVKLFHGAVDYEALHVAKLTDFPLEKRDYKPYSQARICFSPDGLHVQLLSFEAHPPAGSKMCAIFALTPFYSATTLVLELSADARRKAFCLGKGMETPLDTFQLHLFDGEDLQGVFWGGNFQVSYAALEPFFPNLVTSAGQVFRGNLYKLCENPQRLHCGSYYPADFSKPLNSMENLGEFVIIDY